MNRFTLSTAVLLGVLTAAPLVSSAQVTPPPAGQRQRMELERRLHLGFQRMVQTQLNLAEGELESLRTVMRSFQEERSELNRAQASLRHRLRDPALPDLTQEEAQGLLREMVLLQERELELYRSEQEELLKVLSPVQLLRFYSLRESMGQRIQQLRRAGAEAGAEAMAPPSPQGPHPGAVCSFVDGGANPVYPFWEGIPPSLFFRMRIRVLFFASYRDLVGTGEIALDLPEGTSVSGLVAEVRGRGGAFSALPPFPVVAVNEEYSPDDRSLADGDTVAFIPPVAGG